MSIPFAVNMLALLFSLFVIGAVLGAAFSHTETGGRVIAQARQKLRVLMFGWEFPPFNSGGLGVACLGLTRALADKDLDLVFVMPKRLPDSVPFAKMVSAQIDRAPAADGLPATAAITEYSINSPVTPYVSSDVYANQKDGLHYADGTPVYGSDLVSEALRYAKLGGAIAAREPHDLIYAHDWLSFGAGQEAKHVSRKPFIAHVHSTEFDRTGGDTIDQRIYDL